MKKLLILFLTFFSFAATAQIQQPALLSLQEIGGNGADATLSYVTQTFDGGFILCIESTSTTGPVIDSCTTIYADLDIFQKYSADGSTLEWSKCYQGDFGDTCYLYMFSLYGENNVLGAIVNAYTHEFLIHKEDATGTVLWSRTYGDSAEAILESMMATNDGGYIMVGEAYYTDTDFSVHYGSFENADIAVIKVDSNGNKVWSEVIGGSGNQGVGSVVAAPNGGCYIVGTTTSDDYNCTGNHGDSSGSSDAYLARLDSNGNILWHKDLGGTGDDEGNYGWPDGKGGIILGATSGSHDGDVTHQVNYNGNNMWALDVDSSGNILWNNCYGGGGDEFTYSICKATDGSIWIAGDNDYRDSFEVDTFYGGDDDAWFVHTDSVGNFLSAKVMGSTGQDEGFMIYPLSNGSVIGGGYYQYGNGTFNTSWGDGDAFIVTFSPWTEDIQNISSIDNSVNIYPNPANQEVTIKINQTGNYNVVITDVLGRTIYNTQIKNEQSVIVPVNNWPGGVYYVQVVNESGYSNVQKLIVQ